MNDTLKFKTVNELSIFMVPVDDVEKLLAKLHYKLPPQEVHGEFFTLTVRPESNPDYFRCLLRFDSLNEEDTNQTFDLLHRVRKIFALDVVGIRFTTPNVLLCKFPVECVAYEDLMEMLEKL